MKKIVIYLALALLVLAVLTTFAMATSAEKEICDIAMQNPKVTKARCIVYEGNCIVAIKTEKFESRTEYCEFLQNFETQVKQKYHVENIVVTRNPKVMSKLAHLEKLNQNERNAEVQKLIEHLLNRPMPLPIHPVKPPMDR